MAIHPANLPEELQSTVVWITVIPLLAIIAAGAYLNYRAKQRKRRGISKPPTQPKRTAKKKRPRRT